MSQAKAPTRSSFPVGKYKLDASIEGITGLVEFSPEEYAAYGRRFREEVNYNAPPVAFLGRPWNLMIGTVNKRIYKIAPYLELTDNQEGNQIALEALRYCKEQLGNPSSQEAGLPSIPLSPLKSAIWERLAALGAASLFIWDTTDGNVILQTAETTEFLVNLFLTSKSVGGVAHIPPLSAEEQDIGTRMKELETQPPGAKYYPATWILVVIALIFPALSAIATGAVMSTTVWLFSPAWTRFVKVILGLFAVWWFVVAWRAGARILSRLVNGRDM